MTGRGAPPPEAPGATTPELTHRRILAFWAPLAATWLMMSVEGPFLAAIIARLPDPKHNLAAFGVALSFALVLEAPVIMIMGAATALVRDADSLARLRRFTWALNGAVSALHLLVLVPPVFAWIAGDLLGLPAPVAALTWPALALLAPWPAAIGYRRLYQGILIRRGLTRRVGAGTAVRLAAMAGAALALGALGLPGASVGGGALSAGVLLEAVASRWMVRRTVRQLRAGAVLGPAAPPLTYRAIAAFYYPLALSSVLTLGVHPVVTFFLAQARSPVESLAVFPVVRALVFLFSCLGLSYQEVGIALLGERWEGHRKLRRFAAALGLGSSAGLALIAFTPASDLWYVGASGLSADLARLAGAPTRILVLVPALTVLLCYLRSLFVHARATGPITWATASEVATIAIALLLAIGGLDAVGVVAAAAALVAGRLASNLVLLANRRTLAARGLRDA